MQYMTLRCTLQRCNVDGTLDMKIEKCVLKNASPCYYLTVKAVDDANPEDSWKKFDNFVTTKKGGGQKS